jgi:hypothetical protein
LRGPNFEADTMAFKDTYVLRKKGDSVPIGGTGAVKIF